MIKTRTAQFLICLALILSAGSIAFGDQPPDWLQEAAKAKTPDFDIKNVPAVILRNEESIVVSPDGTVVKTVRYAVRVLIREGREEAVAKAVYQTDGEKVRDLTAWLIPSNGQVKNYGKKEVLDISLAEDDVWDQARIKVIDASNMAEAGDVFGYESVTEEHTVFSQFQFAFQHDLPVIAAKFDLSLPTGWKAESVTFNRDKVEPVVSGNTYAWELRNLPPINHEASSPSFSSLSPRLAVSFFPTGTTAPQIRSFANWNDVAKWMTELEDPQMTMNDDLAAKARELTANATTEFERIKAIARFVQQTRYIAIQLGVGHGGGYQPHSAIDVFAKGYGDCKDKANLMRAMLNAVKIQAYLVSITADDRSYVRAEWASPNQFNHCIIAIKIKDDTKAPSVVSHPQLGRLLIFDPTDPYTQVGDLPEDEQGSLALIDYKESDSLTQMPTTEPDQNRLERNVDVDLAADGSINGTVVENANGQRAALFRAELRRLSAPEYNRAIEGWISRGATGAKTAKIDPKDDPDAGRFTLNVAFSARAYAQLMQDRLMVFKPAVVGRLERLGFTEGKRTEPYQINSESYSEKVTVKLPTGFTVDEVPEAAKVSVPFGSYSTTYEVISGQLVFTRTLLLKRSTIPASDYESVRKFFGQVHSAEQAPVVLVRK
jgi:hypothetical protein